MRRFHFACLLAVTTGMVMAACGGVTKDDKQFSSGLPPSEGLSDLSQSEEARLCSSVNGFLRDHANAFCKFSGLLSATVNVGFDTSVSDENIQQVCASAVAGCERSIAIGAEAPMCRSNAFAGCKGTIAEYEGCLSEELDALNQSTAAAPDCSSLTVAYLRPKSSDMPTTDKLVLTNGPACKTFMDHCPRAFSSDASGGSTTTSGASSGGASEFRDAGGAAPVSTCGNGVIDPSEDCDGANLGGQTCATATMAAFPTGTLGCSTWCRFDLSNCSQAK